MDGWCGQQNRVGGISRGAKKLGLVVVCWVSGRRMERKEDGGRVSCSRHSFVALSFIAVIAIVIAFALL